MRSGIPCPATSPIYLADVLARGDAPQYRARPDFDPPAALDPAATAVELSAWKLELEMDMHFAYIYTGPKPKRACPSPSANG